MTVVVWDGTTLSTDKMANDGSLKWESSKAWHTNINRKPVIISGVGLLQHIVFLREWLKKGGKVEDYPRHILTQHHSHQLILVKSDGLWVYEGVPVPVRRGFTPCAFGHGKDFAYGALAMGADSVKAVEVANDCSLQCGKGVQSFNTIELKIIESKNKEIN